MVSLSPENRLHRRLFQHVERSMTEADVGQFINITEGTYLEAGVVSRCNGNMYELLKKLETNGVIAMGDYTKLKHFLRDAKLIKLYKEVGLKADEINEILKLNYSTTPESDVKQHTTEDTRIYRDYKTGQLREKSASWLKVCKTEQAGFICTAVYQDVLRTIRNNSSLLIVGNPGEGRSNILQNVALEFSDDGYFVLFSKSPKEIEKYFVLDRKILFIFDDPFGEPCCQKNVERWTHLGELYFQRVFRATKMKLLIGCSSFVWSECTQALENLLVFKNKLYVCSSNLTWEEKTNIARRHLPVTRGVSDLIIDMISFMENISFTNSCKSLRKAGKEFKGEADILCYFSNSVEEKQKFVNSLAQIECWLLIEMLKRDYPINNIKRLIYKEKSLLKDMVASSDIKMIKIVIKSTGNIWRLFQCKTVLDTEDFYTFNENGELVMACITS